MKLDSKNKIQATFSLSSMTDVIFLLLIFFMLTSSFITPSGLHVNLPSSKKSDIVIQKVSVTITEDLKYYMNDKPINLSSLEDLLKRELGKGEGLVVLHCDKQVPVDNLVHVAGIATSLGAKISLATKPE